MELHFSFSPILLLSILFLSIAIQTLRSSKPWKLPPSPWKLPLIGNLHQLASGASLLHHTLTNLAQKHGPIMYLQLGQVPTIIVSSPEIAAEVLKHHDLNFSDRPYFLAGEIMSYGSTSIVFSQHGGYWKQLRKICTTELFSTSRVQSFQSIREDEVSSLVRTVSLSQGARINLSELIFSLTYSVTSRAAFGRKCGEQERFVSIIAETMKLSAGFSVSDAYPSVKFLEVVSGLRSKFEDLHRQSDGILQSILDQHREKKVGGGGGGGGDQKDLVDVLLEVQAGADVDWPLTDDNIKAVILDIFIGGSESSSTVVEWAMSEMLRNPKVMIKAQAEVRQCFEETGRVDYTNVHKLKFLKAVIKETLRLHPSGPLLMPRESRESCVISGYEIPAKSKVIVNAWAIARDPKYWIDAEKFYPERFLDSSIDYKGTDFRFIPFGAGRRICPGISFSQPNIELPLAELLYHFDWKLPGGGRPEDLDMTEAFGLTVRRENDLFLIPVVYQSSS